MTEITTIYIPQKNSDMTEGRGPMIDMDGFYTTEQAAWDFIGDAPGVMGRRPPKGKTWKDEPRMGDYGVRKIERSIQDEAAPLPELHTMVRDPRDNSLWRVLMVKRVSRGTAVVLVEDEHRVYGVGIVSADKTFLRSPNEHARLGDAVDEFSRRKS